MSLFLFQCYTPSIFVHLYPFGRQKWTVQFLGEEGSWDDFPSAFICLPAFSRNHKHADEHFHGLHHVTLHVNVVVTGSGTSTPYASEMGEMKDDKIFDIKQKCLFSSPSCCTVSNNRGEQSFRCTSPGGFLHSTRPPWSTVSSWTISCHRYGSVTKHALLHFSLSHSEIFWFHVCFSFFLFLTF